MSLTETLRARPIRSPVHPIGNGDAAQGEMLALLAASLSFQGAASPTAGDEPDWVQLLELTLANYALSRATSPPDGFKCSVVGKKHNSCHCWTDKGKPEKEQTDEDCHMPPQCLMCARLTRRSRSHERALTASLIATCAGTITRARELSTSRRCRPRHRTRRSTRR